MADASLSVAILLRVSDYACASLSASDHKVRSIKCNAQTKLDRANGKDLRGDAVGSHRNDITSIQMADQASSTTEKPQGEGAKVPEASSTSAEKEGKLKSVRQQESSTYPDTILVPAFLSAVWHWYLLSKFAKCDQKSSDRPQWVLAFLISNVFLLMTTPFQVARVIGTKSSDRPRYKVALVVLACFNALLLYIGTAFVILVISGPTKDVTTALGISLFIVPFIMILGAVVYLDAA